MYGYEMQPVHFARKNRCLEWPYTYTGTDEVGNLGHYTPTAMSGRSKKFTKHQANS
jgi:hypothetical protein